MPNTILATGLKMLRSWSVLCRKRKLVVVTSPDHEGVTYMTCLWHLRAEQAPVWNNPDFIRLTLASTQGVRDAVICCIATGDGHQ